MKGPLNQGSGERRGHDLGPTLTPPTTGLSSKSEFSPDPDTANKPVVTRRRRGREGQIGSLGFAGADYCI